MPYLPDIVCFKLLGFLKLLKFHFLSQLYQPCNQFSCILTGADCRILETGVQSVLIPAIFWGFTFLQSQIPPEKHTKHTKKLKCIKFTPQICGSPQSTKSKINTGPNI